MPVSVACACGKQLRIHDALAGKRIRCPGCQEILTVPAAEDTEPVERDERAGRPHPRAKGKEKPQPRQTSSLLVSICLGGAICVLLGGVVAAVLIMHSPLEVDKPEPQVEHQQNSRDHQEDKKKPPETKKGNQASLLTDALLAKAFLADQASTVKKYGGKTIELVGVVEQVLPNDPKDIRLLLQGLNDAKNPAGRISCAFSVKDQVRVRDLSWGQSVKIRGKLNTLLPLLLLEDCQLLEVSNGSAVFKALTDEQLMKEYYADKVATIDKYLGKILEVSGCVDRVQIETFGTLSVWLQGYSPPASRIRPWLVCDLSEKHEAQAINLSKGQPVKIRGKCVASVQIPPQMLQSQIVEVGTDPAIVFSAVQLTKEFAANPEIVAKKYHDKALLLEGVVLEAKENFDSSYDLTLAGANDSAAKSLHIKVGCRAPKKLLPIAKGQTIQLRGVAAIYARERSLFLNTAVVVQRKG